MTEVIEEEKYPKSDSYGISDLKNSKMTGSLSCDLGIDLREETTDIYLCIFPLFLSSPLFFIFSGGPETACIPFFVIAKPLMPVKKSSR